ncbi:MAG: HEAT repeat domain-containing protein [Bradymonadaceae bacterium]
MNESSNVAELAERLGHPDDEVRQRARRRLVEAGEQAIPSLTDQLRVVDPDARLELVRVLAEIEDDRTLLPLMRYVFDESGEPEEDDARAVAMRAILDIGLPDHRERLQAFLRDVVGDPDPTVRGLAVEGLGRVANPLLAPYVEEALEDDDEFVRDRGHEARNSLRSSDHGPSPRDLSASDFLEELRKSDGVDREFLLGEALARDDAFQVGARMVREELYDPVTGLRLLQRIDDPRAREVAVEHFRATESDAARAAALRILAEHLEGDVEAEEREAIDRGLSSRDDFVQPAAETAAGASGDPDLTRRALKAVDSDDPPRASNAAEGLAAAGIDRSLVPKALDALENLHRRRLGSAGEDRRKWVRAEAFLLRALAAPGAGSPDPDRLVRAGLRSLEDAAEDRPIVVTALELLHAALPSDGLPEDQRIEGPALEPLFELVHHSQTGIRNRALDLLERCAAAGEPALSAGLNDLLYADPETVADRVVPLLERAGDDRAREVLDKIADRLDAPAASRAEDALDRLD